MKPGPSIELDKDLYRSLLRAVPIPIFFRDVYGNYIGCNPAFENFIDKPRSEIIGNGNHNLLPKNWADKELEKDQEIIISSKPQRYEWHLDKPMGSMRDVYVDKAPIMGKSGDIIGIAGAIADITEVRLLENDLSESTYRLESLLNALPVAIVIIDYKTQKIVDLNPQAMLMLGYTREQLAGRKCRSLMCGGQTDHCPLVDPDLSLERSESIVTDADGKKIPVLKSIILTEIDNKKLLLECFSDISEQKVLENQLREMAETDFLTRLFNRRHFIGRAEKELSRSRRYNSSVSLIMLDIDWFKKINDQYGHAAGDEVLKGVAQICQEAVREIDIVGRIGGEEFSMVLIECDTDGALIVAERIRKQVASHPFEYEQKAIHCTVSIGISAFVAKEDHLENLMKRADIALYRAKQAGRNRTCSA